MFVTSGDIKYHSRSWFRHFGDFLLGDAVIYLILRDVSKITDRERYGQKSE